MFQHQLGAVTEASECLSRRPLAPPPPASTRLPPHVWIFQGQAVQNKLTVKLTSNPPFNFSRKMMSELHRGRGGKRSRPWCRQDDIIHRVPHVYKMHVSQFRNIHSPLLWFSVCHLDKLWFLYQKKGALDAGHWSLLHKTLQELLTFKRLRPSLDLSAAPDPSQYYINYILRERRGGVE